MRSQNIETMSDSRIQAYQVAVGLRQVHDSVFMMFGTPPRVVIASGLADSLVIPDATAERRWLERIDLFVRSHLGSYVCGYLGFDLHRSAEPRLAKASIRQHSYLFQRTWTSSFLISLVVLGIPGRSGSWVLRNHPLTSVLARAVTREVERRLLRMCAAHWIGSEATLHVGSHSLERLPFRVMQIFCGHSSVALDDLRLHALSM
jgi:hypothetical protein